MKEQYICIHGHFYQPPRENPWLEAIETQDSAYPYHDWNERIAAECYSTNATARILDQEGRIDHIVNNYSRISFNVGPTLLSWLREKAPSIYLAIVEADRESRGKFSGHGSALAQAYNHLILPLADARDRRTQILWGLRDFEFRFGRKPEGMWLPETAVDLGSLDLLAELGLRFTILAPSQASRVRALAGSKWRDVSGGKIDPTMAYRCLLPSGRSLDLFFYDGPISRAVAFEGLLKSGESFAQKLLSGFSEERNRPELVHIATDGETYGHHHRYGDMALAYALHYIESRDLARLTNYGEFLEQHSPTHEVEVFENTSWSCIHGVERWRGDCGCSTGHYAGWNQRWRTPLREALDWLREALRPHYERKGLQLFKDPWAARDDYIDVILDRSPKSRDRFLAAHTRPELSGHDITTALKILEMQRHTMLMYTSCGWFFDELSGIETVQVMQYAGRALQLAWDVFGDALEPGFLKYLERAESNMPELRDGRVVYEKFVKPAVVDLPEVAAHYAVSSLFEEYGEQTPIYCFTTEREDYRVQESGRAKLALGKIKVTSEITGGAAELCFGALHLGDYHINCGVRECPGKEDYGEMVREVSEAFAEADLAETIRMIDKVFGTSTYSLKSLFRDEQRKILDVILRSTLSDAEAVYRLLYKQHLSLIRFLKDSSIPAPKALFMAGEFILNAGLRRAFEDDELSITRVKPLIDDALADGATLDATTLEYALRQNIERAAVRLCENPAEIGLLRRLVEASGWVKSLPFQVNLRRVQNICYEVLLTFYPTMQEKAAQGDAVAGEWLELFAALGDNISLRVSPSSAFKGDRHMRGGVESA